MLTRILPFLDWFKGYGAEKFKLDALAGITVALVLIPQSMAYAQLAGLPAYYGLYAAFMPPMIAALFGSSRQLATGPVAVVSLMTAASLEPLATAGSEGYIAYAILLAVLVGVFQLSLGILRLGLVVNFLSHPVVNGFTNAAAIIIASSQLSKMFGVYVDKAEHHYETIMRVVEAAVQYTHWPTLGMGVLAFIIMYGLKRTMPKIPNVLVAVALTTVLSWAIGFQHDARVDVSAIQSADVAVSLQAFNTATQAVQDLSEERAGISAALDEAKKADNFDAANDATHDLIRINHTISSQKQIAHVERERLRATLFSGIEGPEGLTLFPQDAVPIGAETDGRVWRLKVGNKLLDTASLLVTGGGAVVGTIPEGLPALTIPKFDLGIILHLLSYAAIISLLGFMEAISIAKAMAAKTGQRLDPNQELIGQGLANILGALTRSYPVSGSFSRSAVNLQAGAVTGLSSVFTSAMVVIALLFFTPLLYHLPQAVLAAVIMMAVMGLINASGFIHSWKAQRYDGIISVISFLATLAFAPHLDKGIMVGVALSLGVFLYKSMRPSVRSLAMADDNALRCAEEYSLMECEYVDVVRFDGPLFFANASFLEDKINERMSLKPKLQHIVLVASGMNDMDASGEEVLSLLVDRCRQNGVDISLSGVNESVRKVLVRTHLLEKIGEDHIYATSERALETIHEDAHKAAEEGGNCPLTTVCYNS
ncbi:SulP family inorganic anion transporter [Desulfovibrio ferrophilus]|uniref:SulP family sulfate transporter n=1 Tax=Desulfovibrio ferrophilus TaxID=241368 RepID=A0A2Z6AVX8_9BACT|nr:SulP family inorganic anion transporter [Desulfovibrio ferrophilus]BBD07370.1 sulP family sulfate transporter [Desulfovibrio ferrophilus]